MIDIKMFKCCFSAKSTLRYTETRSNLDAPNVIATSSRDNDGELLVIPQKDARRPVRAIWKGPHGIVRQSHDTLRATHLLPGVYSVHITDARGYTSGVVNASVDAFEIPTIVGYHVKHASGDTSRDGTVAAECNHLSDAEHAIFWWTNGAKTRGRELIGVPPGQYAALLIEVNDRSVQCLHACSPATVNVSQFDFQETEQ